MLSWPDATAEGMSGLPPFEIFLPPGEDVSGGGVLLEMLRGLETQLDGDEPLILCISITSSAIMRPIFPAPGLVPPGIPGTVFPEPSPAVRTLSMLWGEAVS